MRVCARTTHSQDRCNQLKIMKSKKSVLIFLVLVIPSLSYAQFHYKNSETLLITLQTSQELIEQFVPEPLVANKDGLINLEIIVQKIDFGSEFVYNEMILSVPVEYNGVESVFHKLLFLNKFNPITTGREIWGFPKHYADINIQKDGQLISATISQGGNNIITLNAELGETIVDADPVDHSVWFVHKKIPSIEKGEMDVDELNAVFINNLKYYNTKTIKSDLTINEIPNENVGTIPVLKIVKSVYFESDFILGFGETLVDYNSK